MDTHDLARERLGWVLGDEGGALMMHVVLMEMGVSHLRTTTELRHFGEIVSRRGEPVIGALLIAHAAFLARTSNAPTRAAVQ